MAADLFLRGYEMTTDYQLCKLFLSNVVVAMDWRTRGVLSWKLLNTLDGNFCLEALEEALRVAGRAPEIFNTDQGSQFTSEAWIGALEGAGARMSMDGKGRWLENVLIERLGRSVKHEGVYLWHLTAKEGTHGVWGSGFLPAT